MTDSTTPRAADLDDRARTTIDRAASSAHGAVDRAHDTVDQMQQRAHDVADRVSGATSQRVHDASRWIADHPMKALAGALVAGYLVGRMRH